MRREADPTRSNARRAPVAFASPRTVTNETLLDGGRDDRFRDLLFKMVSSLGRLQDFREAFAKSMALSPPQFAILIGVAHQQGRDGVSIRDLAIHVRLASTHVTTEVGRLCRSGHLEKRPSPDDRRSVLVRLTSAGERAVLDVAPFVSTINDLLFAGGNRIEFDMLITFFNRFSINCEVAAAEVKRQDALRSQADHARSIPETLKQKTSTTMHETGSDVSGAGSAGPSKESRSVRRRREP